MRTLLLWLLLTASALAQGCGDNNFNCVVPTAPPGTSDDRAASTAFVTQGRRLLMSAPLDLYTNYSTGSDANNCLVATPCQTAQGAFNRVLLLYDTAGQPVTIHVAVNDSTCLVVNFGWVGGGTVTIQGPGGAGVQPTVGFTCSNGHAVKVNSVLPANLIMQNIALSYAANFMGIYHVGFGEIVLDNVAFNAAVGGSAHIYALGDGAKVSCPLLGTTMTMTSQANYWIASFANSSVICANSTINFIGAQTYAVLVISGQAAAVIINATKYCDGYGPSANCESKGVGTGPTITTTFARYQAYMNGIIDTVSSANPNFLPGCTGSTACLGTLTQGGQYN